MSFLATWAATAIATFVAIWIVPGITAVGGSWMGPIMCALALAFVNAFIKPVIQLLSLPITILTLGIFNLVINALMLIVAGALSTTVFGAGIQVSGLFAAIIGSIVISLVSSLVSAAMGQDDNPND